MPDRGSTSTYRVEEFDVLRHQRRKLLLLLLLVVPGAELSITRGAELIAVFTTGARPRQLDAAEYNRARQSLKKSHLAVLADAGAIVVEGNSISRGPAFVRYCVLSVVHEVLQRIDPARLQEGDDG